MHILRELPTISLEELIDQAAMLTRVDRKYVLHREELSQALENIDPDTRVLNISNKLAQPYKSVYFDTPDQRSFYMAAHKRRRKFKVRTRTYVDSGTTFLEVKATGPRGVTVKERMNWDPASTGRIELDSPTRLWLEEKLLTAGQERSVAQSLEVAMVGTYNRTTMLMADGQGRATIDTELDWLSAAGYMEKPNMAIVETKSGARPSQIDRLLWSAGHRPAKISKFGTGMAALDSRLPRNRWNRVLKEYF